MLPSAWTNAICVRIGPTTTPIETSLERPLTVSWAVTTSFSARAGVRFETIHWPRAFTMTGAPRATPLTKSWMLEPGMPVPLTVLEPACSGPVMVGVNKARNTPRTSLRWLALTVCPTTMVASLYVGSGFPAF